MMSEPFARLLGALQAGDYVSGQSLSEALGVSRAAVWKYMQSLRDMGAVIEAAPRLGYKLISLPDRLFPALITPALHTRIVGKEIVYLDEVDSTNNYAKTLAQQGCGDGTVVIAESQTAGRGRLERSWVSPSFCGLWMSTVLRPRIASAQMPRITLLAALAVYDAITRVSGVQPGIKWPNDVLIGGRKCCGILVDMGGHWEQLDYVVVGTGINVREQSIPAELEGKATALDIASGKRTDRGALCIALIEALDKRICEWLDTGDFAPQLKEYCSRSATLGKAVRILSQTETISGVVEAFDELGMIMLRLPDGRLQRIASGDVSLREA